MCCAGSFLAVTKEHQAHWQHALRVVVNVAERPLLSFVAHLCSPRKPAEWRGGHCTPCVHTAQDAVQFLFVCSGCSKCCVRVLWAPACLCSPALLRPVESRCGEDCILPLMLACMLRAPVRCSLILSGLFCMACCHVNLVYEHTLCVLNAAELP